MRRVIVWCGILIFSSVFAQQVSYQNREKNLKNNFRPELVFTENAKSYTEAINSAAKVFPELNGITIRVKRKPIKTMMAARPKSYFLFTPKEKREYVIIISDREEMHADAILHAMSMKAQIGVAGHELSHILSYTEKNNRQMLWFGIEYVFKKKEIEAETDLMAIKKGFGGHIMAFNHFLYQSPKTNKDYLKKKKKYYFSASDIKEIINKNL